MNIKDLNQNINNSEKSFEEEIDFKGIIRTFKRNKIKIISLTFFTGFISIVSCLTSKPYWKGEFDIVLSKDKNIINRGNQLESGLFALLSQRTGDQSLNTQVEIHSKVL